MTRYFLPAFLLLTLLCFNASAATLFGRVVEVNDGDVITVFNLNRPVRVKLLAVDAPERDQTFGDVAKKHLSELVYDKSVLVEYSGIAPDGSLVGRVTLNNVDVGAQMIRDGAAWFDASNHDRLSAADRDVYQQSEQAARRERRGLWQAENPIAPWEFVRAQTLRRNPAASLNTILPAAKERANRPTPELTSFTLLATRMGGSSAASPSDAGPSGRVPWEESARKNWHVYKPTGENFTALMPEDARHAVLEIPYEGETYDLHVYAAREGWAIYALMWITGPTSGESDKVVADQMVQKFLEGFGEGYKQKTQQAFNCELEGGTRTSVNGYSRSEFELSSCTIPARVRVYTRVTRGNRQVYVGAVFYVEEDENVSRFIKSFTIGAQAPKSRTPKR
jgi:endonuclease YncB( thermonuclease family)